MTTPHQKLTLCYSLKLTFQNQRRRQATKKILWPKYLFRHHTIRTHNHSYTEHNSQKKNQPTTATNSHYNLYLSDTHWRNGIHRVVDGMKTSCCRVSRFLFWFVVLHLYRNYYAVFLLLTMMIFFVCFFTHVSAKALYSRRDQRRQTIQFD